MADETAGTVSRYQPDGTPDEFAALGTNVIDGKGTLPCTPPSEECDATPQGGLSFSDARLVQVAVDNSGGATDGDIYVTQATAGVVDIFDSEGNFLGQLTASSEGFFGLSCGVAVDGSGAVYVGEFHNPEGKVHKYVPSGAFPANGDNTLNFAASRPCAVAAGAGPTAGSVFVTSLEGPVWKFNGSTGVNEGEGGKAIIPAPGEEPPAEKNTTVAVDPESGHLFSAAGSPFSAPGRAVNEYDASGSEATLLSSLEPAAPIFGLAVSGESGDVYVAESGEHQVEVWGPVVEFPGPVTEAPCAVGAEGATLCGSVNPNGVALTECVFEWGLTTAYGEEAPCEEPDAAEVGSGASPVPVHAQITGLAPGTHYHYRLAAANANNAPGERVLGEDEALLTGGASITEEMASLITPTSARLSAHVNPNGEEATYVFEYVTQAQFDESVAGGESGFAEATALPEPPAELGSGSEFEEAGVKLSGLVPETAYRFRIAVTTPAVTDLGPDLAFTTFAPSPPSALPDERAYELVSPPKKTGEVWPPEPSGIWTGSCDGCLPGFSDEQMPMQATEDGEEVAYEGSPFSAGLASGANEYLSSRGSGGWTTQSLTTPLFAGLEEQGYKAFSADLSRSVIYQNEPAISAAAPADEEGVTYSNLFLREADGTLVPLVAEAPPQREAGRRGSDRFKIGFAGANAGAGLAGPLQQVIFEANDALTEAVPDVAPEAPPVAADERNLYEWEDGALRLVNVAPDDEEAISGATFGSGRELTGPEGGADFDGAISADGSRIFFSKRSSGQVYVRINGEETQEVTDPGKFVVASADGSRVLLSDGCLYSVEAEGCEEDLTGGEGGFEGILGAAEDLSRIYFVDSKELDEGAEEGKPNLYAWDEGETSFIATLVPTDDEFRGGVAPQAGDWQPSSESRTAQVSPDGRFLAFMSRAPLMSGSPPSVYDNRVRGEEHCRPGQPAPCAEVFEYSADSKELTCASCNPSGERPLGASNLSLIRRSLGRISLTGLPQPSNLTSEDGRLFFESQDALVAGDVNGDIKDVYEWEPDGIGSCAKANGCLFLISSGRSPDDSIFLDATPSGDDAFLITRERLLPPDQDERLDLYDARVGGGFLEPTVPPCGGQPCQEPRTPAPSVQGPASAGFSGLGNVPPKKKHHKKHRKHHKKHKRGQGGSR